MSVIYVKEQGAYIRLNGEKISVVKGQSLLLEIPIHSIDSIIVLGNVQVTMQALTKLLANGTDISYFTYGGKYIGHTISEKSKNIFLRFAQYELYNDKDKRLALAKIIVNNKIMNQINLIKNFHWEREDYNYEKDVIQLETVRKTLEEKTTNNEVMGVEGLCSNIYFQCFRHMLKCNFSFEKRNRRPPRDPVNAILSLAYTFLTKDMCTIIEGESFEAYLGFLHGIRYGRKSLALDLIEEWRQPIVDRLVLRLFNKKMLSENNFQEDTGTGVFLNEEGFKKFCKEYEKWMAGLNYKGKSFRSLMKCQVNNLKKTFENGEKYILFIYEP